MVDSGDSGDAPVIELAASCRSLLNALYSRSVSRVPVPTMTVDPSTTAVDDGGPTTGDCHRGSPVAVSIAVRLEVGGSGANATPLTIGVCAYDGPASR